jgi:NTE family protein
VATLAPRVGHVAQGAYTGRLFFDQLDSATFPRAGHYAMANIVASRSELGADDPYTKWSIDTNSVFSAGNHTVNFGIKGGGKIGSSPLPSYDQFHTGGFLNQSGYRTGALAGDSLAFGRAIYYHKLGGSDLLQGLYGGFSLEAGRVGHPLVPGSPTGLQKSGSVFIAVDTYLGPLYLGYGFAAGGTQSLYLFLGRI